MEHACEANGEQAALWNGAAGHAWIETQAVLDRMFEPLEALLAETLPAGAAANLLDIGCGTGATTLAFARRLGADAECLGVDLSGPMIALAHERALRAGSRARFSCADAQVHAFEPGRYEHIVSRFGVMFFDDPARAFANLRRAARSGARLCFVAWRSAAENPFMTAAERAVAPLLPDLAARRPGAPGQFAFADPDRVAALLAAGGWTGIDIRPVDVPCTLAESDLRRYASSMGPVGLRLQTLDEPLRSQIIDAAHAAFEPYVRGDTVRFNAACWWIEARA